MKKTILALEAIDFQPLDFFKELTMAVEQVKQLRQPRLDSYRALEAFNNSPEMQNILKVIKKHTNLTFVYEVDEYDNIFASLTPVLSKNHIFIDPRVTDWFNYEPNEAEDYIKMVIKNLNTPYFNGSINLHKNWVSGDFAKLVNTMILSPIGIFNRHLNLSSIEIAAIILHEVGHSFTFYEFLSRVSTTNQVLSSVVAALKTNNQKVINVVMATGAQLLKLSPDEIKILEKAKTEREATVILYSLSADRSVSELGKSIYDSVSCEQLADQYSTRLGGGKYLVTALNKLTGDGKYETSNVMDYITILLQTVTVIPMFLVLLSVMFIPFGGAVYDNDKSRFERIKHQLIQKLKEADLDKKEKQSLIDDIEQIGKISAKYEDKLDSFNKIRYLFSSNFRASRKYELLQKELEQWSNNGLFVKASKLSTI